MRFSEMFPSKHVAADDLAGQDVTVTIARVVREKVGADQEMCTVAYFSGMTKGMCVNKTNGRRIKAMYGDDSDGWIGKPITLYPSETEYAGETVPCIRVRQGAPSVVAPPVVSPPPPPPPVVQQPPVAGNGPASPRF